MVQQETTLVPYHRSRYLGKCDVARLAGTGYGMFFSIFEQQTLFLFTTGKLAIKERGGELPPLATETLSNDAATGTSKGKEKEAGSPKQVSKCPCHISCTIFALRYSVAVVAALCVFAMIWLAQCPTLSLHLSPLFVDFVTTTPPQNDTQHTQHFNTTRTHRERCVVTFSTDHKPLRLLSSSDHNGLGQAVRCLAVSGDGTSVPTSPCPCHYTRALQFFSEN